MLELQVPPFADYYNAVNTLFCNTTTEGHHLPSPCCVGARAKSHRGNDSLCISKVTNSGTGLCETLLSFFLSILCLGRELTVKTQPSSTEVTPNQQQSAAAMVRGRKQGQNCFKWKAP